MSLQIIQPQTDSGRRPSETGRGQLLPGQPGQTTGQQLRQLGDSCDPGPVTRAWHSGALRRWKVNNQLCLTVTDITAAAGGGGSVLQM